MAGLGNFLRRVPLRRVIQSSKQQRQPVTVSYKVLADADFVFEITRAKGQIVKGKGVATVNNELACMAEIMVAFSTI
jgi:hypothetical protein